MADEEICTKFKNREHKRKHPKIISLSHSHRRKINENKLKRKSGEEMRNTLAVLRGGD
jgi:hypothetical protein